MTPNDRATRFTVESRSDWRVQFEAVRPLARYVDETQAVIDAHFTLRPQVPTRSREPAPRVVELLVEVDGDDGFHDEQVISAPLTGLAGAMRIELVSPQRWWPAGMGDQPLYTLTLNMLVRHDVAAQVRRPVGLTSVRRPPEQEGRMLLVNGREYRYDEVYPLDLSRESALLPVGGKSLVLVRDHFGPDVLYEAADRAGMLLIQCVPIAADGQPELAMDAEVTRLAAHPSLAGWCVAQQGDLGHAIARRLRELDPTHAVFLTLPESWAA